MTVFDLYSIWKDIVIIILALILGVPPSTNRMIFNRPNSKIMVVIKNF